MYQTLDDIQYVLSQPKDRIYGFSKIFRELKVLGLIFTILFLGTYLITNAQLVIDNFNDYFNTPEEVHSISQNTITATFTQNASAKENSVNIDKLIKQYGSVVSLQQEVATNIDSYLQQNLNNYEFSFNILPPTNRLIIPAINLDVPLIESNFKDSAQFTETTFDGDLENGVVKYPTTPDPGQGGNTFFFGHTSQEYWKNNPYGTVFRKLPQLKEDDKIQIVRNGVLYEYKVLTTVIVKPKDVNDTYVTFGDENKEYITLMGCYPIGRTDKRMMVFAQRI